MKFFYKQDSVYSTRSKLPPVKTLPVASPSLEPQLRYLLITLSEGREKCLTVPEPKPQFLLCMICSYHKATQIM